MKIYTVISALLFFYSSTHAQLANFDAAGKKSRVDMEKILIEVDTVTAINQAGPAFVTILSSLIGVGTGALQAHLSSKQESYTATFSGRVSGKNMMKENAVLSIKGLRISRTTRDLPGDYIPQEIIKLKVIQDGPVFRFETDSIIVTTSKARIKKGSGKGKALDYSITIKVDASWRKFEMDSSGNTVKSATLESATLGESSITCEGIRPGVTDTEKRSSEWFKMLPQDPENLPAEMRGRGWYSITVTVKEANPYGVTSKKIADFFKDNNEGITGFLQSFIPEKKSDKSE